MESLPEKLLATMAAGEPIGVSLRGPPTAIAAKVKAAMDAANRKRAQGAPVCVSQRQHTDAEWHALFAETSRVSGTRGMSAKAKKEIAAGRARLAKLRQSR